MDHALASIVLDDVFDFSRRYRVRSGENHARTVKVSAFFGRARPQTVGPVRCTRVAEVLAAS